MPLTFTSKKRNSAYTSVSKIKTFSTSAKSKKVALGKTQLTRKVKKSIVNKTLKPLRSRASNHLLYYPTPSNINYNWSYGSLVGLFFAMQIITGIFLARHYTPHVELAFSSVEHIRTDVFGGATIRYFHANGGSAIFILRYLHTSRGLYYQSYRSRPALWYPGLVIFLRRRATAFIGYVLPWGQRSFWGATVITSLVTAVPLVGEDIAHWVWGGFSIDNATLTPFFSAHYLLSLLRKKRYCGNTTQYDTLKLSKRVVTFKKSMRCTFVLPTTPFSIFRKKVSAIFPENTGYFLLIGSCACLGAFILCYLFKKLQASSKIVKWSRMPTAAAALNATEESSPNLAASPPSFLHSRPDPQIAVPSAPQNAEAAAAQEALVAPIVTVHSGRSGRAVAESFQLRRPESRHAGAAPVRGASSAYSVPGGSSSSSRSRVEEKEALEQEYLDTHRYENSSHSNEEEKQHAPLSSSASSSSRSPLEEPPHDYQPGAGINQGLYDDAEPGRQEAIVLVDEIAFGRGAQQEPRERAEGPAFPGQESPSPSIQESPSPSPSPVSPYSPEVADASVANAAAHIAQAFLDDDGAGEEGQPVRNEISRRQLKHKKIACWVFGVFGTLIGLAVLRKVWEVYNRPKK